MKRVGPVWAQGRPQVNRYSLDDPEYRAHMLRSGAILHLPMWWQIGIDAIARGEVPLDECKDVPPEILKGFRKG